MHCKTAVALKIDESKWPPIHLVGYEYIATEPIKYAVLKKAIGGGVSEPITLSEKGKELFTVGWVWCGLLRLTIENEGCIYVPEPRFLINAAEFLDGM